MSFCSVDEFLTCLFWVWPLPKKTFETNGNAISTTDLKSELLTKILWRTFSEAIRIVIMQRPFPGNLKPCGVKPCFFGSFFPSAVKADWILSCLCPSRKGRSLDCGRTGYYEPLTDLGGKTASATPYAGEQKTSGTRRKSRLGFRQLCLLTR